MTSNWIPDLNSTHKWEHITQTGTFLVYENYSWKLIKSNRIIAQIRTPSCPFRWAEDILRDNRELWKER